MWDGEFVIITLKDFQVNLFKGLKMFFLEKKPAAAIKIWQRKKIASTIQFSMRPFITAFLLSLRALY